MKNKEAQKSGNSIKKVDRRGQIIKKMKFYSNNLLKLLDQQEEWFFKRFEYVQEGNWEKADEIDDRYLKLLERKIQSLAKIAHEDLI